MYTKEAGWPHEMDNHELLKLTLKSLLLGGGAYGAARLGKDIYNEFQGPKKSKNELSVELPQQKIAEDPAAPDIDSVRKYILPTLAGVGGIGAGFFGASKIYDKLKNHFLEKEMKKQQQNYLGTLQSVNQKMASSHPLTDDFLKGVISKFGEEFEKTSGDLTDTLGSLWHKTTDFAGDKLQQGAHFVWDKITHGVAAAGNATSDKLKELYNKNEAVAALKAGVVLSTLGTGGATYMIMKNMDKKKEEAARQSQIPTDLKLNAIPGQSH